MIKQFLEQKRIEMIEEKRLLKEKAKG